VITRKTVEWHLKKAFDKLDIRSRDQLPDVMDRDVMDRDLAGVSKGRRRTS
jgi:DNA-binding NarL/FixJ family response regulator